MVGIKGLTLPLVQSCFIFWHFNHKVEEALQPEVPDDSGEEDGSPLPTETPDGSSKENGNTDSDEREEGEVKGDENERNKEDAGLPSLPVDINRFNYIYIESVISAHKWGKNKVIYLIPRDA